MSDKLDPRIKRTRHLIRQAMNTLMQKKHFQDITVQELTEEAGINRATFYAHFVDKQALMNYTIREMLQERIDSQLPVHPTLTLENLRLLIVTVSEFMAQTVNHCSPVRDYVQPLVEAEIQAHLSGVIQSWIEQTALHENMPADITTTVLSWSIFGAALEWSRNKKPSLSAKQLADRLLPLIAAGVFGTSNTAKS